MALRDKLVQRTAQYLQPGEQVQAIWLAQTGPSPYWMFLTWLILLFGGVKYCIVVATDRQILVVRAGWFMPTKPKSIKAQLPRNAYFGELGGLWAQINLDERYWVHKRFHKDVAAADQALAAAYAASQQQAPQVAPPAQQAPYQQWPPPQG